MNPKLELSPLIAVVLFAISLAIVSDGRSGKLQVTGGSEGQELLRIANSDGYDDAAIVRKLAKYRDWTLVNPTPVMMDPGAAQACAPAGLTNISPHASKFISVFVNRTGRDAMLKQREPSFPVGSIIVKEKLKDPAAQSPELLTVMVKREEGYDSTSGDWEYFVMDGAAATILNRGRLPGCNSCHTAYKQNDYVTRTYLPDPVRKT